MDTETQENVALKMEKIDADHPQLQHEARLYGILQEGLGMPTLRGIYRTDEHVVLVTDLLGPSLEDLFCFCNRRFTPATALHLAQQLVRRLAVVDRDAGDSRVRPPRPAPPASAV